ncbi:MAG: 4-hydroxy-tetrahydrodipicolinate reductase [Dehalococcoidia bacterium]|nr:4-hydroxy-tetrahydrodipicolinate reductase [Dehalococcoidia bacterium]
MSKIRVLVHGALGKMGQTVITALRQEPDMELVGAVDISAVTSDLSAPNGCSIPLSCDIEAMLGAQRPDVVVDFSTAKAMEHLAQVVLSHGVRLVSGTTGLNENVLSKIEALAKEYKTGAIVASNFAIGALVMQHLAKIAARYFDYAEIIEEHHQFKLDAPSGTALSTAKSMVQSRGKAFIEPNQSGTQQESRGQQFDGICIHSVRMPGIVARQEILLGGMGQTLSIKHDAINRDCYMPGVMLAIREIGKQNGLIVGLEKLLGL